jgi:hypothetical protein
MTLLRCGVWFLNPGFALLVPVEIGPARELPPLPAIGKVIASKGDARRRRWAGTEPDAPRKTRWIEMDKEFGAEIVRAFATPLRRLYTFDERDLPLPMAEALERLKRIERDLCRSGRPPSSKPNCGGPPH